MLETEIAETDVNNKSKSPGLEIEEDETFKIKKPIKEKRMK